MKKPPVLLSRQEVKIHCEPTLNFLFYAASFGFLNSSLKNITLVSGCIKKS